MIRNILLVAFIASLLVTGRIIRRQAPDTFAIYVFCAACLLALLIAARLLL